MDENKCICFQNTYKAWVFVTYPHLVHDVRIFNSSKFCWCFFGIIGKGAPKSLSQWAVTKHNTFNSLLQVTSNCFFSDSSLYPKPVLCQMNQILFFTCWSRFAVKSSGVYSRYKASLCQEAINTEATLCLGGCTKPSTGFTLTIRAHFSIGLLSELRSDKAMFWQSSHQRSKWQHLTVTTHSTKSSPAMGLLLLILFPSCATASNIVLLMEDRNSL